MKDRLARVRLTWIRCSLLSLVLLAALTGCQVALPLAPPAASPGPRTTAGGIDRIAYLDRDGNLYTVRPDGSDSRPLRSADAGSRTQFQQPTWSPNGDRIAWVELERAARGPQSRLVFSQLESPEPLVLPLAAAPFYLQWSPTGEQLAYLSSGGRQGLALGIATPATASATTVDSGQPYYLAWAPDGRQMVVHVGGARLSLLDLEGGHTPLSNQGGSFAAPHWSRYGDLLYYVLADNPPPAGTQTIAYRAAPLAQQPGQVRQRLVRADLTGQVQQEIFDFAGMLHFSLSPDGQRIAFVVNNPTGSGQSSGVLHVLSLETGQVDLVRSGPVVGFFWSPDSGSLSFLQPEQVGRSLFLRWYLYAAGETRRLSRFLPTPTLLRDYLPFFDQYAHSVTFWSPAGDAFVFAGSLASTGDPSPGIWVQSISPNTPPVRIADGLFAAWSPR